MTGEEHEWGRNTGPRANSRKTTEEVKAWETEHDITTKEQSRERRRRPKDIVSGLVMPRGPFTMILKNKRTVPGDDCFLLQRYSHPWPTLFSPIWNQEKLNHYTEFHHWNLMISVLFLFLAGTESTSNTLCYGFLLMLKYPHVAGVLQGNFLVPFFLKENYF